MTAKEFLKQYERADKYACRLRHEYEREREMIDSIRSSLNTDGLPHGTGVSRPTEEKALRLTDAFLRWKDAELSAIAVRQEVFELIAGVPDVEGDILYERYIMLRKWEQICILVNYTWSSTHRAHRRALRIVQDRLDELGI